MITLNGLQPKSRSLASLPQPVVPPRGGWLRDVSAALLSIIFPAACRLCQTQLLTEPSRIPICNDCLAAFPVIHGNICDVCGKPIEGSVSDLDTPVCPACSIDEGGYAFQRARSWGLYQPPLSKAILLLKFDHIDSLGGLFARHLMNLMMRDLADYHPELIVPVPLHRQRERERGYNQAALIAKPLARLLGLPCKPVLLTRIRPRPDKHLLTLDERWSSVRGAFATRTGSQVDNLRVLLVDDVMTSGATLDACAKSP